LFAGVATEEEKEAANKQAAKKTSSAAVQLASGCGLNL